MVQALAFAEIFLGLILADAGYKGVSVSSVVKGEAGESVEPAPLGTTTSKATSTGSTPGATTPAGPQGDVTDQSEAETIAKGELLPPATALSHGELKSINERFGPQVNNTPPGVVGARP